MRRNYDDALALLRDDDDALAAPGGDDHGRGDSAATRERVLASLARRGVRRRQQLVAATVLAFSLCGTAAWGWASGWLPAAVDQLRGVAPVRLSQEQEAAPEPPARAASGLAPEAEPPREEAPAPPPPPPVVVPPEPQHRHVATPAPPPPAPDPEIRAFRLAHEAHFRGDDPAAALAAWDAYLADYPDGKLAPEARWNRAVLLVRLGRSGEARRALEPFAAGAEDGYRQREASELLARLPR